MGFLNRLTPKLMSYLIYAPGIDSYPELRCRSLLRLRQQNRILTEKNLKFLFFTVVFWFWIFSCSWWNLSVPLLTVFLAKAPSPLMSSILPLSRLSSLTFISLSSMSLLNSQTNSFGLSLNWTKLSSKHLYFSWRVLSSFCFALYFS